MMALLLATLIAAPPTLTHRVAVVAARNDGGPARERLRWTHHDAEAIAAVFGELGDVAPGDRLVLLEPDRHALEATLAVAQARLALTPPGARSELVFYYSGHADAIGLLLGDQRYPFAELRRKLEAIHVDLRLVVVDACAAGALLGERGKGGQRTAPFLKDGDLTGHAYLTSAAEDEIAQESDRLEASFFTHDFVAGLRGAADADRDRTVTLTEAYRYAFDATLARTQRTSAPQHPAWDIALVGAGDVVLTRLDRPSARLVLGPTLEGRMFVRGPREALVAEVDKALGDALELALPPGAWTVGFNARGRRWQATTTLADRPVTLERPAFVDVGPAMEGRARGEAPTRVRLSLIPLLGFEGLGDDVIVHGAAFALIGDRLLAVRGAQLALVFNVTEELTGAQIGLVNVAGRVRGAQIGLVNIADDLEGASLGLFPWVGGRDGLRHLEVYGGGGVERPFNLGWRVGARWLHTAVALATDGGDCDLSIGTGTEIDLAPLTLGFELGPRFTTPRCDPARLGERAAMTLRTILGWRLTGGVALFAGATGGFDLSTGDYLPGWLAGVRLFR